MSQWFLSYITVLIVLIVAVLFLRKLAEEISLQSASKRFPSFSPPANGNKSNTPKNPDFAQIET